MARKKSDDSCAKTERGILDSPWELKCSEGKGTENEDQIFQLESDLEEHATRWPRGRGWYSRKYRAAGGRGVPDRFYLRNGRVLFVEFKRRPAVPTVQQWEEIQALLDAGADALYVDSIEDFRAVILDREKQRGSDP